MKKILKLARALKLLKTYKMCSYSLPFGYALAPLEVTFEVTYRCNLRCKMCPLYGPHAKSPITSDDKELSLSEVKNIVDQIGRFSKGLPTKPSIYISGGEPFIREDILQIMEYIRLRNITYSVVTNGSLIDKEKANRIVALHPKSITFSLDGPERIHDKIRGTPGTFAKAVNAIKMIEAQASAKDLSITVNCVISSLNLPYLGEMVYLAHDLGTNLQYQHVMFLDENTIEKQKKIASVYFADYGVNEFRGLLHDLYRLDTAELVNEISKIVTRARDLGVNVSFLPNLEPKELQKYYLEVDTYTHSKRCIYPWSNIRINPYGEVHPCLEYPVGNLRDHTLSEIYNGPRMRYFRRILKKEKLFPACARCCKI